MALDNRRDEIFTFSPPHHAHSPQRVSQNTISIKSNNEQQICSAITSCYGFYMMDNIGSCGEFKNVLEWKSKSKSCQGLIGASAAEHRRGTTIWEARDRVLYVTGTVLWPFKTPISIPAEFITAAGITSCWLPLCSLKWEWIYGRVWLMHVWRGKETLRHGRDKSAWDPVEFSWCLKKCQRLMVFWSQQRPDGAWRHFDN